MICGPNMWETMRRLLPTPYRVLPTFLGEVASQYGDISTFAVPWRRFVFVNDPEAIKEILVTQQSAFIKSTGVQTMRWLLGEGLLTSEDPLHRQMRRIVQPAFHHARVAGYARTMVEQARAFVERLVSDENIEMHAAMSELALRIATTTLFGTDEGARASAIRDALGVTIDVFPEAVGPFGSLRRRLPLPSTRAFERARATLDGIVYGLIAERRRSGEDRGDALSLLLTAEDAESGERLSDAQIRDEVLTLFIAGHETTANVLTWTWYLLAQNPHVEGALQHEVAACDLSSEPFELFARLEYTQRVVREAMRLYPPAWILGRESRSDVTLLGRHSIKPGVTVLIAPLVLHRTPSLYPDPLRFNPDRWLAAQNAPFAYIPFGGGARRCIGEEFAWMEITLVLAIIARSYSFTLVSDAPIEPEAIITLRPKGPVRMRAHTRVNAMLSHASTS